MLKVCAEALAVIERERCSIFYATPNIVRALTEHPDRARRDLSSLRSGATIGTPEQVMEWVPQCYGTADDVPEAIKAAMKLMIGHWYLNRESVQVGNIVTAFPLAVEALLGPYLVQSW